MPTSSARVLLRALLCAAIITTVSACEEPTASSIASTHEARKAVLSSDATHRSDAHQSLADISRLTALALGDQELRIRLRDDLRNSRATVEHKLHLADYLAGPSGSSLLAKMAHLSGKTPEGLLRRIASLRGMELYMPVDEHRTLWTGGANLLVASQLKESENPVGYLLDGTPVPLTNASVPETPTLVIVPSETDFARLLPVDWQNVGDRDGQAIGTYKARGAVEVKAAGSVATLVEPIDPCLDDPTLPECQTEPPPPPPPPPGGTYLDFSSIDDLGESWVRGDPEIEVHLIAPTAFPGNDGEHLSCSSGYRTGPKWFNQDGNSWYRSGSASGALFLKTDYDVYYYNYTANNPIGYQFWEDDDAECQIRGEIGRDKVLEFYDQMRRIYEATAVIVRMLTATDWVFAVSNVTTIQGAFASDDDFIGIAVDQQALGYNHPDATHVLMRPVTSFGVTQIDYNGRVRLLNITQ